MANTAAKLLTGAAEEVPPNGLAHKMNTHIDRPLTVKLGFDPTAPDLHLGHAVVLRKLRDFQDSGHRTIVIVGDFTARIGDPTGRNQARPPLDAETVRDNAKTYLRQLGKVLDITRVEVRYNSEWLDTLGTDGVVRLMSSATVSRILSRDDFRTRMQTQTPISLHELLYPLLQAYDSFAISSDVELGGTDQLFNCMMGRDVQEALGQPSQVVISLPLLVGTDGVEKMSKSKGNYIALEDKAEDMYGKCMSIPDSVLLDYLVLAANFADEETSRLRRGFLDGDVHPMALKKAIAHNIVTQYHGIIEADEAEAFFVRNVQNRSDMERDYISWSILPLAADRETVPVLEMLQALEPHRTRSDLRRLMREGAVSLDGDLLIDPTQSFATIGTPVRVKIGKRGFYKIFRN